MYFDEDLILDIRLNTLNEYVDKFVISEATRDHAGNDKKLNFDIKKFSKFKNKIIYVVEENLPKSVPKFKKNLSIKLNLLNTTNSLWPGTKICVKKFLKSPQWLRNIKTKDYPFWKFYKPKTPQLINDGGWHFSFLKKPKDIAKKIKSYAHQELNKEEFTDINLINNRVELGRDIFDRDFNYKKIELNSDFPKYILENKLKFKDWIL